MPLFGRPKAKVADTKSSLDSLRESADMLEKRESHLRGKAEAELERARQLVAHPKTKRHALQCLSRKRTYEAQADRMSLTRFNIEQQAMALEHSTMNVGAMEAMRDGAAAMRAMQKNMTLDDVDDVLDDIQETMEVADEISNAISQPMGAVDDDELLAELEEFEQKGLDEELLAVTDDTDQEQRQEEENRPGQQQPEPQTEEDAEFAALEASMAL
jgi:charged multivesicular body protein 4